MHEVNKNTCQYKGREQGWWEHLSPTNVDCFNSQVEFVIGSYLCSITFLSSYYGLPLSLQANISKFQFDLMCPQLVFYTE